MILFVFKKAKWRLSQQVMLSMPGTDFVDHVVLPAVGTSGGILATWRRHLDNTGIHHVHENSVTTQFCSSQGQLWWLTCVYGPQGNEEKIQFMQELRDLRANCTGPWLLVGDFNLILRAEDKNNAN